MYLKSLFRGAQRALLFFAIFTLFSQTTKAQSSNDWTLHETNSGVEVYFKITKCISSTSISSNPINSIGIVSNSTSVLLLKFVNTTSESKSIDWNAALNSGSTALVNHLEITGSESKVINCEAAPVIVLAQASNDTKPKSLKDALTFLSISITTN